MSTSRRFACDAMLGGLARWLRAAGYVASWQPAITDWDLIRKAKQEDRTLLTSDTGIFKIGIVRDREVPALFIPHGLTMSEQLRGVLGRLNLRVAEPRCMACGGELNAITREQARERVPPRTFDWLTEFHE